MINSQTLREKYRRERRILKENSLIGTWILSVLTLIPLAVLLALVVRFSCAAMVAVHHLVNQ